MNALLLNKPMDLEEYIQGAVTAWNISNSAVNTWD
jgi:hypothetical protein